MKKVLIVEDNEEWCELLTMVLQRSGYEVVVALTGKQGVEQAIAAHPDLILMDLGLPGISGDEATVKIKSDPKTKDIPIVVQTAFGMGPEAKRAIAAGAAEIMDKPISITALQRTVKKYLSEKSPARLLAPALAL
jgi:two-component system cell cycle response regulator DivK